MSSIRKTFSTLKEAVTGVQKHLSPPSSETSFPSTYQHQEHLDTSGMAKILVIGETGAGKSTFINYLTNYFRQGTLQNLKVAIPSKFRPYVTEAFSHCEHEMQDTTQSKTDACNQYMLTSNGKQYLFLDTPGLSDTRGAKQDDENIIKIVDSVESLGGLTAVIIVVNGAVGRLTVNLRNVIARLRGNLPDIIISNVILVLTNATRHAANFSVPALGLNGNVYPYYMQNSAFSQDSSTWTASALAALQYDWDQAMSEIEAMLQTIDTFKTKSVTAFQQMKDIRNEIKTQMHAARLEVSKIQKMQDEIAAFEICLKQSKSDLVTYKDYTKEREVDDVKIVDAPFHSTLCQNCNHVCHPKCRLEETTTVGAQIFQRCWAMSSGNCRQCQHKCSYTAHYHAKKTVETSKRKLQDILTDIKVKYDQAANDKSDYQQKIHSTEDAKKLLEKALWQKKEDIKQLCIRLRSICSGFNIAQELHALIDQLEVEAAMLKNIEAKQQANVFIHSLKEFCSMLENDQDLSQNQSAKMNIINTERPVQNQVCWPKPAPANNMTLAMQPKNNINTSFESSLDSGSYANDDVLQAIRDIGKKKTEAEKKKKKPTNKMPTPVSDSEKEEEEEKESGTATDEDSEKEPSNEKIKKRQKKTKKQTISNPPSSDTIDEDQFKTLTINELLSRYRTCTDQRMRNFIVHEMMQRSQGKSVGPLNTPEGVVDLTTSSQKYCALNANALRQVYQQLKARIAAITEPDILKIEQVPSALLLEIAAVYILLQRAPPDDDTSCYNFSRNYPNNRSKFANDSENDRLNTRVQTQSKPALNQQSNRPPYSSDLLERPSHHPEHYDDRPHVPIHTNEPPPYDNGNNYIHYFSHRQQPQQLPPFDDPSEFVPRSSSSSNFERSFDNMHLTVDHRDNTENIDTLEEVRKMNNNQLLAAYNDAYKKRNHSKTNLFYNELQRRCYGDHPLLIQEKQKLFENITKAYQGRSISELKQSQIDIHQRIRDYLTNDDATHINNIPTECIIEAAVLTHLIAAANPHS